MTSTTRSARALKQEYREDRVWVASRRAILKPDGSAPSVHAGTHGAHVNQEIKQKKLLAVPGPVEVAWLVRQALEQTEPPFSIKGDARRKVLIRKKDWSLLACRADSDSPTVFVNLAVLSGHFFQRLYGAVDHCSAAQPLPVPTGLC